MANSQIQKAPILLMKFRLYVQREILIRHLQHFYPSMGVRQYKSMP